MKTGPPGLRRAADRFKRFELERLNLPFPRAETRTTRTERSAPRNADAALREQRGIPE
jgi:hypothetical protein